jgi:sulfur carrier protein ThiS
VTLHVKLSDFLARLAEPEFEVETTAGQTLAEFIKILTQICGEDFRKAIVDREGKLHPGIAVVFSKRFIPPSQMAETIVDCSGHLSIIPLAGGG